jgi:hypothetical protein
LQHQETRKREWAAEEVSSFFLLKL